MENSQTLSGPPNYVAHAFTDQHNLILLLGAASFALAFASPIPLFAGAAGELGWLAVGSRVPAFRKWVDRRLDAQRRAAAEDALDAAISALPAPLARRYGAMNRAAHDVLALVRDRRGFDPAELASTELKLRQVRTTFLDFQLLSRRVTSLIEASPTSAIELEAAELQDSYSAEKDLSVRMTIRKAMAQNQRQQQQLQQLTSVDRTVELRLSMIEKALGYLKGQVSDAASNLLSYELDSLLAEVGTAARLEAAINDAFSGAGPSWAPNP